MKTDTLIEQLARGITPVEPRRPRQRVLVATVGSVLLALPLMWLQLGLNPQLAADAVQSAFWVKTGFVVALLFAAAALLVALGRPGAPLRTRLGACAVPIAALWSLAAGSLANAGAGERMPLVLGRTWTTCVFNIALLALPGLVLALWALRGLMPTSLRLAGAGAGLLAGSVGALVYLLHCPELAAPFLAVWYVAGVLTPAALGALLGPLALRW